TKTFRCCYHGWTYKQDGSLLSIPNQAGYDKTPDFDKTKLSLTELRTETYRGFVFATFNKDGHGLTDSLGGVIRSLDIMVDRSPDNELEIAGGCFRALYRNNWKIYLENLHDGMHPMFVHRSSITASQEQAKKFNNKNDIPLAVQIVKANEQDLAAMEELEVSCYENGHSDMRGFRKP
ncbi:MAG: Rieske 2Fe-2S domain-containing protein, partial [Candidatus Aminicenantes bacterium]|nr:Rieske 2Fe-2S domain-containing protein [Gammaproteobacteria bacterium]NIO63374.1 Rieske 2Fe-2S domain-containing protein [Gammaproteobacteria bacterium]NIO85882.1 Rieske 2Fe-2S domain-containing protein [Candidatus Aminicenantes bacterium]NIT27807.1 Rieske 2Fe-2S domain-containing protein [Candidatus Aminicenantes bacterium]